MSEWGQISFNLNCLHIDLSSAKAAGTTFVLCGLKMIFLGVVDTVTLLTVIVGPHCLGSMQLRAVESLTTAVLLSTPASSFVAPPLLV